MEAASVTITPSPEVKATVRLARPPELVPDELLPYVSPQYDDDELADWHLTADVVAFADVEVPTRYAQWRASWERAWELDSHTSIGRLLSKARKLADPAQRKHIDVLEELDRAGRTLVIEQADTLTALADAVEELRDVIGGAGASGYAFVDATEGTTRVGLVRAWSAVDGPEVLAANDDLAVRMEPATGLCVEELGVGGRVIVGVEEAIWTDDVVRLCTPDETVDLDLDRSVPLAWVVPGSTRWRVRSVPEVLVWARTFGNLAESARHAAKLHKPLVLSVPPG